jgi:sugar phosphate isomerase/epimerase
VEVLISRFIDDENMDLRPFEGADMQVAFYQRKVFHSIDHRVLSARLRDSGISVKSVHAPATDVFHRKGEEFVSILRTIKEAYGVEVITVHPQKGDKAGALSHFRELEGEISALGVVLAYETFEKEMMDVKWVSQVEEMHRCFDAFAYPFLRVTYDFTHSSYEESVEEVAANNSKIQVVHLSDALRDRPLDPNEFHQHLPLGYGDYRVLEFLELLERIGYAHFLVLEYHPEYDALLRGDAAAVAAWFAGDRKPLTDIVLGRRAEARAEGGRTRRIRGN